VGYHGKVIDNVLARIYGTRNFVNYLCRPNTYSRTYFVCLVWRFVLIRQHSARQLSVFCGVSLTCFWCFV